MFLPIIVAAAIAAVPEVCRQPTSTVPARVRASAPWYAAAPPVDRRRHVRVRASATAARCLRLRILQRREALLRDFIIRASTEQPQFSDPRAYRLDRGITVGPVVVTRDFVGSPIIRARVTNLGDADASFLLSATLQSAAGTQSGASAVVFLHGRETRTVELLCPDDLSPRSLTWSTMPL